MRSVICTSFAVRPSRPDERRSGHFPLIAFLLAGSIFAAAAGAQSAPQIEWARQFGGLGLANERGLGIASDHNGNTYVAGSTNGAFLGLITSAGLLDAYLRKYDPNGNELWTRQFGTIYNDEGAAVAVDPSGNVYVAGSTEGSLGSANAGGSDAYIRKYDGSGNVLWTRQFGTAVLDNATALAADVSGVYVTGRVDAGLPLQSFAGISDVYVRKYDPGGSELWTRQFGSAFVDISTTIFVDNSGVYVGGQTTGVIQDTLATQTNAGLADAFVRKYSVAGDHLWSRTFGTTGLDIVYGVAGYATGVYVSGQVAGALPLQTPVGPAGDTDAFVRKYEGNGSETWTRQFGTIQTDAGLQVYADASGVYVGGITAAALDAQPFAGVNDAFVRKYDPSGGVLWTSEFGSTRSDGAACITGDAFGVYVAGTTNGTLPLQLPGGNQDAFVRKYTSAGGVVWTRQFGYPGPAVDRAYAVASNGDGKTYVAGQTNGALPGQTSMGIQDAFLSKHDASGALVWSRQFGTPAGDIALAVAADDTGVYVGGSVNDMLPTQTYFGLADAFIRKYDQNGNLLWTSQFGTPAGDTVNGIAVNASGVYVAGQTLGTLADQSPLGDVDAFVRKYSKDGVVLWTRQFGSSSPDLALAIATGSGGVYVSGITRGKISDQPFGGVADAFVRKYDDSGNALWTREFGTAVLDEATAVAADDSGVYVAGRTDGVLDDPLLTLSNAGVSDLYVRKFSHIGAHLWTRQFGSPGLDTTYGLATHDLGVYMTGSPQGAVPPQTFFGGGLTDAFIRKYDRLGNEVWTFTLATPFNENGRGIVVDGTGTYVVGDTQGTLPGQTSSGDVDAFILKLDTAPPTILSAIPSKTALWPPNNKMVLISVAVSATDAGTPNPSCQIASVSSNEPGGGQWQIMGPLTVNLMASRNGNGNGRIYTITVQCSDPSGNTSSKSAIVTVPHDQGK